MKSLNILFTFLLISATAFNQVPQKMSYQAVIRNTSNLLIANQVVGIQISILQGSISGSAVYVETQSVMSNTNGLVSLEIGTGIPVIGTFSGISWANGPFFIKTETDPSGGNNYTIVGTNQLLSVPYSLYAETSGSSLPGPPGTNGVDGLDGLDGVDGKTLLNGIAAPTFQGVNGDFFLNTSTSQLYGPKVNGSWGTPVNLIGPQGPVGPVGPLGSGFTHFIGEHFGGGIIFHLWKDSLGFEHGLIIDLVNLPQAQWGNPAVNINTSVQSLWNGSSNSLAIDATNWNFTTAASLCLNSNNGGYTDWYLPAQLELEILRTNLYNVSKSLNSIPGANQVLNEQLWTSTAQVVGNLAIGWTHSGIFGDGKNEFHGVRAIRSF